MPSLCLRALEPSIIESKRSALRTNKMTGEAARRMSDDFRQAHPEIPWSDIIGQRNVIAHQYEEIRQERIWSVVTSDIPTLIAQLEPLIPPLPPEIE
ncbi:HepT-like ribonuclease domain-containing protein [Coleofasciculus sp.]|uniref:HepT-like ribonuclease domain-containing protein n=1 Tax=Coleofasciculus sp. TaxID=3100458 RepID=UPI0039FA1F1B